MKILCVIDHLGSGGAQRQLVGLACELRRRGHDVDVFVYHPDHDFFRGRLDGAAIPVHEAPKRRIGSSGVARALARLLRRTRPDGVVAFLATPAIYTIAARLASGTRPRLLVSERSSHLAESRSWRQRLRALCLRVLFVACDAVVANSETQAAWLRSRHAWLRRRVHCIFNGLATDAFRATPLPVPGERLRLLAIGRVGAEKNPLGLMQALQWLQAQGHTVPDIFWAGPEDPSPAGRALCARLAAQIAGDALLAERWHWLGRRRDITDLLQSHDALIHPAFYEGFPNAVCEAFAAARPVLLSAVCDHPAIAGEGERGVLFDPADPASIGAAIVRFGAMTLPQRQAMAARAFAFARAELTEARLGDRYEALLRGRPESARPKGARAA
ncbi:MAG: glycosyltransferase family 4 protein [Rubrivivax sp.]|nr:glycosyltransferase family 4 protein [Rubrivivax sp.]